MRVGRFVGRSLTILAAIGCVTVRADDKKGEAWPSFRGCNACGVSNGPATPVKWDLAKGENVKWITPIPGMGHSCPIVWGDRVYVTTAINTKGKQRLKVGLYGDIASVKSRPVHKWELLCLDKNSGKILWEKLAYEGKPRVLRHTKASHCNSTPATDGKYIVALFGSEGIFCFDMDGKLLWKKDLGPLDSGYYMVKDAQWGFGSSPIIYKDRVIVQADVQENSFLAAFDLKDGHEIWRTPRKEVPTWGSPTLCEDKGKMIVAVNGYKHIGGYDVDTGKEVWKLKGGGDIPVPTPVVSDGLIYITNAHGMMAPIYAVRSSAAGDIKLTGEKTSNESIAWSAPYAGNYMQTPLVVDGLLYSCRDNGGLSCFDAKTGDKIYTKRVGNGTSGFTPSAVACHGVIYYTSEDGDVFAVKAGKTFQVLGKSAMGSICMASPAISDGLLLIRTQGELCALAEGAKHAPFVRENPEE